MERATKGRPVVRDHNARRIEGQAYGMIDGTSAGSMVAAMRQAAGLIE